ncbi:ETX/MTX2 family pore-forming toxin [Aquella oligotrophica]|uniref:Uncharacterized protein n=1 Tax=Aquella oligotrophica TaxID=2067065 RepID=A0A2I7N3L3_9NEIS|nr:ETX/MTX2 family pore-forming toxin [Aquella oligotrophica]AUR50825.1 hypothetical protein CUN60_00430 [Aquella oligotrophica]
MKLNKLYLVVAAGATLLSTNAYAWHNEITKNFRVCNETGVPVKVGLAQPHNIQVEVPGGAGINTKWEFPLSVGACGVIKVQPDWGGYGELTKFRLSVYRQDDKADGSSNFAVDIRSATTGKHEDRTTDGGHTKMNVFNVHSVWQKDGWNILAPIKQSYVYERKTKQRCTGGRDPYCWTEEYFTGWKNHDEGIIGLKQFADGAGLALLFSKSDTQDLYLVSDSGKDNDELSQVLNHEVYDNFNKLNNQEKQQAIRTIDDKEINLNEFSKLKLCQVFQPSFKLNNNPNIEIKRNKPIELDPIQTETQEAINNTSTAQEGKTLKTIIKNTNTISTQTTTGWKAGTSIKFAGSFGVKDISSKSFEINANYEFNSSNTETKTEAKETSQELQQTVKINPRTKVSYYGKTSRAKQTGSYKAEYELKDLKLRAKIALDGNCSSTTHAKIDPYVVLFSPNAVLDKGLSVNHVSKSINIITAGNYTGEIGYHQELVWVESSIALGLKNQSSNPKDFIKPLN